MQVMSPHLAAHRRAAVWDRQRSGDGASGPRAGTVVSFRKACLIIAAWLLALLLVPIVFFQPL
jgi:hypothetical protein